MEPPLPTPISGAGPNREAAARAARAELINRSTAGPVPAGRLPWCGEDGLGLSAGASLAVERFSALAATGEPGLTAAMDEISRSVQAELAGLAHRLKDGESMKRKLATQQANTGSALPELLERAQDAVRYTVVLADQVYSVGVGQVSAALEERGYHRLEADNAWACDRYRGFNTTWADPSTGIAFEVQFHTPASWQATRQTHHAYEEFRRPGTSPERRADLSRQISAAYRAAPVPEGALDLAGARRDPAGAPSPSSGSGPGTAPGSEPGTAPGVSAIGEPTGAPDDAPEGSPDAHAPVDYTVHAAGPALGRLPNGPGAAPGRHSEGV